MNIMIALWIKVKTLAAHCYDVLKRALQQTNSLFFFLLFFRLCVGSESFDPGVCVPSRCCLEF